jgi:hypothetical protein
VGSPSSKTDGVKAVAVAELPEATIFASHSVYGVSFLQPDKRGAVWTEINAGIEKLETTGNPDEVSDIAVSVADEKTTVFASQTFRRRLYRLDWDRRRFEVIWSDKSVFGLYDDSDIMSLRVTSATLRVGGVLNQTLRINSSIIAPPP